MKLFVVTTLGIGKTNNLTARDLTYLLQRLVQTVLLIIFIVLHVNKTNEISKVEYNETEQLLINTVIEEIANHIKECDRLLQPVIFENYSVLYYNQRYRRMSVMNYQKSMINIILLCYMILMRQSMSLRTVRDDVDLAVLARKYGGGVYLKQLAFQSVQLYYHLSPQLI